MQRQRIPELDGIRGLAILMVLGYHIACYTTAPDDSVLARLCGLAIGYSAGVDLFFVLSGFLIGGILLDNRESLNYYRIFYLRRFYRIMPIYSVLIATYVLLGSAPTSMTSSALFAKASIWPYPLFLQNFFMAVDCSFGPLWLASTWSLCIEEQFYLTLPFIVKRLKQNHLIVLSISLIVLASLLRVTILTCDPTRWLSVYVLMPCRMDGLLLGVLIAIAFRSERAKAMIRKNTGVLTALFAVMVVGFHFWPYQSAFVYLYNAVMFGSLLLLTIMTESPLRAVFRLTALRRLGDISYGLYLIHPIILFLTYWFIYGQKYHIKNYTDLSIAIGSLSLSVGIAYLSWRFFEKPLLQVGQRAKYQKAIAMAA